MTYCMHVRIDMFTCYFTCCILVSGIIGQIFDDAVLSQHSFSNVLCASDLQFGLTLVEHTTAQYSFVMQEVNYFHINQKSVTFVTLIDAPIAFDCFTCSK